MTEAALISPRADSVIGPMRRPPASPTSWFRTREGRRFGIEIGLIIAVKLALLGALWLVLIHPWPRPVTPPATVVQQLYLPAASAAGHD